MRLFISILGGFLLGICASFIFGATPAEVFIVQIVGANLTYTHISKEGEE